MTPSSLTTEFNKPYHIVFGASLLLNCLKEVQENLRASVSRLLREFLKGEKNQIVYPAVWHFAPSIVSYGDYFSSTVFIVEAQNDNLDAFSMHDSQLVLPVQEFEHSWCVLLAVNRASCKVTASSENRMADEKFPKIKILILYRMRICGAFNEIWRNSLE